MNISILPMLVLTVNLEIIVAILDTQGTDLRRFHISRVLEILQEIKFRFLHLNYHEVKHKQIQKKEHHVYGSSVGSYCYYTIEYFTKKICVGRICRYVRLSQQVKKCVSTWQSSYFDLVFLYHTFKLMGMFYNISHMHASEGCILTVQIFVYLHHLIRQTFPAGAYLLNYRSTKIRFEFFSKLTIKSPRRCEWRWSGVFIVNFEKFLHIALV